MATPTTPRSIADVKRLAQRRYREGQDAEERHVLDAAYPEPTGDTPVSTEADYPGWTIPGGAS